MVVVVVGEHACICAVHFAVLLFHSSSCSLYSGDGFSCCCLLDVFYDGAILFLFFCGYTAERRRRRQITLAVRGRRAPFCPQRDGRKGENKNEPTSCCNNLPAFSLVFLLQSTVSVVRANNFVVLFSSTCAIFFSSASREYIGARARARRVSR